MQVVAYYCPDVEHHTAVVHVVMVVLAVELYPVGDGDPSTILVETDLAAALAALENKLVAGDGTALHEIVVAVAAPEDDDKVVVVVAAAVAADRVSHL